MKFIQSIIHQKKRRANLNCTACQKLLHLKEQFFSKCMFVTVKAYGTPMILRYMSLPKSYHLQVVITNHNFDFSHNTHLHRNNSTNSNRKTSKKGAYEIPKQKLREHHSSQLEIGLHQQFEQIRSYLSSQTSFFKIIFSLSTMRKLVFFCGEKYLPHF